LRKVAGLELEEINTAKAGALDEASVKTLVTKAGGVKEILNTRHAIAKEKGWADNPPDAETFAKAAVKDVNLLRRPIVLAGKQVIVGFNKTAYSKLGT
jgi:arsenate reductase-like glutaredoxin family protein